MLKSRRKINNIWKTGPSLGIIFVDTAVVPPAAPFDLNFLESKWRWLDKIRRYPVVIGGRFHVDFTYLNIKVWSAFSGIFGAMTEVYRRTDIHGLKRNYEAILRKEAGFKKVQRFRKYGISYDDLNTNLNHIPSVLLLVLGLHCSVKSLSTTFWSIQLHFKDISWGLCH